MKTLEHKVAVITGSSRGFGWAVAQAYAEAGAAVVISSRTPKDVEAASLRLQKDGYRAFGVTCDVSQLSQVQTLARRTLDAFGQLDIWVNNAAIAGPYGPTVHLAAETFKQILQTNVFGVYHGSVVATRHFLSQGEGKLINILGRGASKPTPYQNAYASSKAWIRSFTLALADEYKDSGVSVLAYNPGMMTTDLLTSIKVIEGYGARLQPFAAIVRMWAKPPEVPAARMVALASDQNNGKTGRVIRETGLPGLLWGAIREGARRLMGTPGPEQKIDVETVPPAFSIDVSETET